MAISEKIFARVQQVAGKPAFSAAMKRGFVPIDRAVGRLSKGRLLLSGAIPSMDAVVLHTTGAKTGQPRDVPITMTPDGDRWLLIGSNFGGTTHPAWSANLLAHPQAEVTRKGDRFAVAATLLTGDARAAAWQRAVQAYPAYDDYARRAGREIRVFEVRRA